MMRKRILIKVPIVKGTVPHEQEGRFGGAHIFLSLPHMVPE